MKPGSILKKARIDAGLSQGDVSKSLGYTSPQYISNAERMVSNPSPKMLRRMADMYSVDYKDLASKVMKEVLKSHKESFRRKYGI